MHAGMHADRGSYTLKVKNSLRESEHSAQLKVLSAPGKPKGPLEVSNVTEEGCTLDWRPPEDDGGEPIECYEVEKMDTQTGKWVPVARTKDTSVDIKGLQKGKAYHFRVKAVNKEGQSEPLQTDRETIAKNPYDEPGKPGAPDIVDWNAHSADLQWEPPVNDGGAPIEEYIVEKKSKHDRNWKECGRSQGPACSAHVDGLKEGDEYEFRVVAVNKAGPGEPSDPSRKMIAKNRFEAPRIDRSTMPNVTVKQGQTVEFKVKVTGEPPPNKEWFYNDRPIGDVDTLKTITVIYL
jgi:predicted phage tail protein